MRQTTLPPFSVMHELNFPAGLIRLQYFIQAFESRENAEDIIDKNKHEFYHYTVIVHLGRGKIQVGYC